MRIGRKADIKYKPITREGGSKMEWVNMAGFLLSVSTVIVGLGSFVAACGPNKIGSAKKAKDYEVEGLRKAA